MPKVGGFGGWVWVSLSVIFVVSTYSDISRFLNPDGEKYMPGYFVGGQIDFSYPYLGARALVARQNPYTTHDPEFIHPIFGIEEVNGKVYHQLYPPGHLLTYVPLTLFYGKDVVGAGRFFFHFSLGCLVGLGFLIWRLLKVSPDEDVSPFFVFVAITCLLFQPGTQLGLERGQNDVFSALLCWTAIFLVTRGRHGWAVFLAVWAANIKAYPVLFTAGICLTMLRPGIWRRALFGAACGLALFLLPAVGSIRDGLQGTLHRSNMFSETDWYNHGFKNLIYHSISLQAADSGRAILTAISLVVAALWGWRLWQQRAAGRSSPAILTLILFGLASLLPLIGYSSMSISYNLILILPGFILLAASQDRLVEVLRFGRVGRHVLGATITAGGFALFLARRGAFPLAALGLVILLGALAVLGIRMPSFPKPTPIAQPEPQLTA